MPHPSTRSSTTTTNPTLKISDLPNNQKDNFNSDINIISVTDQTELMPPINIDEKFIFNRAIPTNRWWTNMIGPDPYGNGEQNFPVYTHPFRLTFNYFQDKDYGLHVCYSSDYRAFLQNSENGYPRGYIHGYSSDFIFSAVEFETKPTFQVIGWDDNGFGVSADVRAQNAGSGVLSTNLVTGMAFITAQYKDLTPRLVTSHAFLTVENQRIIPGKSMLVTGTKFVTTNNKGQKWVIYSSKQITFNVELSTLQATSNFQDITLRIALVPDGVDEKVYDLYSTCIVTGGSLEIHSNTRYAFNWDTRGDCTEGLLHFGFPHHEEVLDKGGSQRQVTDVGFTLTSTTRGKMSSYATPRLRPTRWTMTEVEKVPVNDFFPPRDPDPSLVKLFDVPGILATEIGEEFTLDNISYYFTGKMAQKYATMCLLATDTNVNSDRNLVETCIRKLQQAFGDFLNNNLEHPLVYDQLYRGIVSSEGFTTKNVNADFGNTVYNDHHFHYGYWIMAGAILKKLDPAWTRIPELNKMISLLIRDVANTDSALDPDFPQFRHFDWFAGHSSSHGLVPFVDGKDQESTSEEMNFHYALMLWGKVSKRPELQSLGELMMKVNKRSVGHYLMMEDTNTVHPQIVPNKIVGIFFENKIDYTTWFGAQREFIHGIQMIPVSPVNEFLRTEAFVREEWFSILQGLDLIHNPDANRHNSWQSLLFANYAVINKIEAMEQISLATMDPGLSRAWALYFAATRP